jgi:hypothetical protein
MVCCSLIILLIAGRRPCTAVHGLLGFFGAAMSRTGSHPRRPDLARVRSRVAAPSQALKNAPVGSVFHRAISAPPGTAGACQGAIAAKTLPRPREQQRQPKPARSRCQYPAQVRLADTTPRSRRVFLAFGPAARVSVRGVRRRPGNERCPKGALLSACSEP